MHFRVKEIQGTATIIRAVDNKLKLEVGDFFYPEELATLEVSGVLVYWNDATGETFTAGAQVAIAVTPAETPVEVAAPVESPAAAVTSPAAE